MSVVALTSARGAPGVTTSAVALALHWPRPCLLVEADVAGGSAVLAGFRRGAEAHAGGLVDLAAAHRHGRLVPALDELARPLAEGCRSRFVPGLTATVQAAGLGDLWEALVPGLREVSAGGTDVLVDAGRAGARHGPDVVLGRVDRTLLVSRTDLPAVAASRARAHHLGASEGLASSTAGGTLALLLVGPGMPYSDQEVARAVGLPVAAALAWDPVGAAAFSRGAPVPKLSRRPLPRSVTEAVAALDADLSARDREWPVTAPGRRREGARA